MTRSLHVLIDSVLARAVAASAAAEPGVERTIDISPPFSTVEHGVWAKLVRLWLAHASSLIERQPSRSCPACGADASRSLFSSHDGYPFNECLDCGCWFVPRHVTGSLYAAFFEVCQEARSLADSGFDVRSSDKNLAVDLERIGGYLDLLVPLLPASGSTRYLDIGAGTGSSLLAARARGLDAVGVESAPRAFESAAKREVRMLDAASGLPKGPFTLISLWETLEHLDDPLRTLRESASALAPHGLLAITVPNLDSLPARIMRGDCSFIGGGADGPGHVNLFGSQQLERLFARADLSCLHLDGQYSTNFLELAGYVLGRHRGAFDLIQGGRIRCRLPARVVDMLNSLGPTLALLERETLLSPILMAVACRRSDRRAMQGVADRLQAACEQSIAEAVERLGGASNSKGLVESLQEVVKNRDRAIAELQAAVGALQNELQILRATRPLVTMIVRKLRSLRGSNQR